MNKYSYNKAVNEIIIIDDNTSFRYHVFENGESVVFKNKFPLSFITYNFLHIDVDIKKLNNIAYAKCIYKKIVNEDNKLQES